jgi:hypothetical protein
MLMAQYQKRGNIYIYILYMYIIIIIYYLYIVQNIYLIVWNLIITQIGLIH